MFHPERSNDERTVLFCLHYLGGSAHEWSRVAELLRSEIRVVAIDLPGFGSAAHVSGYSVDDMARAVAERIVAESPRVWMVVGHSMGAKVAAALARRAEDGEPRLAGLAGLVLVAGSPPSPEPIPDATRAEMLNWFGGDAQSNHADAQRYITQNSGPALDAVAQAGAVADALRLNRAAWIAWLEQGSREDWSARVGVLKTPTLVIAGAKDENLGPDAQHRLMAPHLRNVRYTTLPHVKHLLPLEAPRELARAIDEHVTLATYAALIVSERVSHETRTALLERGTADGRNETPVALDDDGLAILRAVVSRVVPQPADRAIDLAARIDQLLASGIGDGWRFADLPPDVEAYRIALRTLDRATHAQHGRGFVALTADVQDAILRAIAAGTFDSARENETPLPHFHATQMKLWFQDVRADAIKLYVAHPHTLARMGYSGIANGGDGMPKTGFVRVGIDEREVWEPIALAQAPA